MPVKNMSTPTISPYAKNIKNLTRLLAFLLAIFSGGTILRAATIVWSGASGVDTNWSDSANWVGGILPGPSDDVKFFDMGAGAQGVVSNVVDGAFGGYIGTLQYGNTNNSHTTLIASGVTLNVTN